MMLEHPDITVALRTGYPRRWPYSAEAPMEDTTDEEPVEDTTDEVD